MDNSPDETADKQASETEDIQFLNGSSTAANAETAMPLDSQTVKFMENIAREIEEEVQAKRAQGAFPPAFERRLKSIFERLVPPGAGNTRRDFEALLRSSDRAAYFDVDVPTASQKPGVAKVKKILRMTQAWYLNYLAQQLNNFTTNLMRLLYVFDARVKRLEDHSSSLERVGPSGFLKPFYPDTETLEQSLLTALKKIPGRVLVADCGNGYLVSYLKKNGVDAYGVDSFGEPLDTPFEKALDLRWQDISEHLSQVSDGSLAGVVLQGSLDAASSVDKIQTARDVRRTLLSGGTAAIIGLDPEFYQSASELVIQRDLGQGRPFSPKTWEHVLSRLGFHEISTQSGETSYLTIGFLAKKESQSNLEL